MLNNSICIIIGLTLIFVSILILRYYCLKKKLTEGFRKQRFNRYRQKINKLRNEVRYFKQRIMEAESDARKVAKARKMDPNVEKKYDKLNRTYQALRLQCAESEEELKILRSEKHSENDEELNHASSELKNQLKELEQSYSTLGLLYNNTNEEVIRLRKALSNCMNKSNDDRNDTNDYDNNNNNNPSRNDTNDYDNNNNSYRTDSYYQKDNN